MSFEIIVTQLLSKLKRLAKRYKSISVNLTTIFEELENNPTLGTPLGKDCYKIHQIKVKKKRRRE